MAALLIGRYQPLHDGHKALVREALRRYGRVVVGLRHTEPGPDNPYGIDERRQMIIDAFPDATAAGDVQVLDLLEDITNVVHGRKVGWTVDQLRLPEDVEKISGSDIRSSSSAAAEAEGE